MERTPKPNEIYQHFKGNLYKVITLAKHSETGEMMVVYQALYGQFEIYVRPLGSFVSEVDHEKYPEAAAQYRFTLIPSVMGLTQAPNEAPASDAALTSDAAPASGTAPAAAAELTPSSDPAPDESGPAIDPAVMDFLDAETYKEKLDILIDVHSRITDNMLNTMAVSLDLEVGDGSLEEKYYELKNCLITLEKYECDRLR